MRTDFRAGKVSKSLGGFTLHCSFLLSEKL